MKLNSKSLIEILVKRDEKKLINFLTKYIGDADIARDIAQSSFLRTWEYAEHTFIENPTAFLYRTAINLAKNEVRRRVRYNSRYVGTGTYSEEELDQQVESLSPNPERQTSLREEVAIISDAIQGLPKYPRVAFMLSRFDGFSYKEISTVLEVSESSVEKYMMIALKRLRVLLKNAEPVSSHRKTPNIQTTTQKQKLTESLCAELSI